MDSTKDAVKNNLVPPDCEAPPPSAEDSLKHGAPDTSSHIQWACVVRDKTMLAMAGEAVISEGVESTARQLLNMKPSIGWDIYQQKSWRRRGGYKGLKFPVYQEYQVNSDQLTIWTFACVYNSAHITTRQAKSFLEKIVAISEMFREVDDAFKRGRDMACQDQFGPVLQQRMDEVTSMGEMAIVDGDFELSNEIIDANRDLLNRRDKKNSRFYAEEALLAQMEALNQEVLTQRERTTSLEEEMLKQMEDLNKQVLNANEKKKANDLTSGPWEPVDANVDESGNSEEGDYFNLKDGAISAIIQLVDDEVSASKCSNHKDESATSITSPETSSNHREEQERITEVSFLLDKIEHELDTAVSQSQLQPKVKSDESAEDLLLGRLDYEEEDPFYLSPNQAGRLESLLREIEGDIWEGREARMLTEVRVDELNDSASALTESPVDVKRSTCFLCTLFSPTTSPLI